MKASDIKFAMGCDHNRLWICQRDQSFGQECTGPCKYCTTTQLKANSIICPICDSPSEFGYCINIKCVNHG